MALELTVTPLSPLSATTPLVQCEVVESPLSNAPARAYYVEVQDATTGARTADTGPRLRKDHLLGLDQASDRQFIAAVKDVNGLWSERSDATESTAVGFLAGSGEASIGSGLDPDDLDGFDDGGVPEPMFAWPQLSVGSGRVMSYRTEAGSAVWVNERRRTESAAGRWVFTVTLDSLSADETDRLRAFVRSLRGPFAPFWFDWRDPWTDRLTRHVVRFRDAKTTATLLEAHLAEARFALVEVADAHLGGHL